MKTKNYQIVMINKNTHTVEILTIVKSKGLAYKVFKTLEETYKGIEDVVLKCEESKKKLKEMSLSDYKCNECKI